MKPVEEKIIFQGNGYRILSSSEFNVRLEIERADNPGKYSFGGFYQTIHKAIRGLILRDLLINRSVTFNTKSYLDELEHIRENILADIDQHFDLEEKQ